MENNRIKAALFRADGSLQIGMGHIMRCLALAQGLEKINIKPKFVTRNYSQKISETIRHYGCSIETIPADSSRTEDLRTTLDYAENYKAKLIITDLGHADTLTHQTEYRSYLQDLKVSGRFLITIDDLNEMDFPSDIVINPNCGAQKIKYPSSGNTKLLLGPDYFIFRQEFIAAAPKKKQINKRAVKVLVSISGSDPFNLTSKIVRSLAVSKETSDFNLRIVLGIDYSESKISELEESLKDYKGTYEIIQGGDNLAELMVWSDLIITGAGLTKYEAAVTGTPCIIITPYVYLEKLAQEFAAKGTALNLGLSDKIKNETIASAIVKLLGDVFRRAEMSKKGKELVDGRGIERIISEIPQEVWA